MDYSCVFKATGDALWFVAHVTMMKTEHIFLNGNQVMR